MNVRTWLALSMLGGICCGPIVGCGRSPQVIKGEKGEQLVIDESNGVKLKTKEGTFEVAGGGKSAPLPAGFPADVPAYEGRVSMATTTEGTIHVMWETTDGVEKVGKFYAERLPAEGWKIEADTHTPETIMLIAKKEGRECSIVVQSSEGSDSPTTVQAVITEKR